MRTLFSLRHLSSLCWIRLPPPRDYSLCWSCAGGFTVRANKAFSYIPYNTLFQYIVAVVRERERATLAKSPHTLFWFTHVMTCERVLVYKVVKIFSLSLKGEQESKKKKYIYTQTLSTLILFFFCRIVLMECFRKLTTVEEEIHKPPVFA